MVSNFSGFFEHTYKVFPNGLHGLGIDQNRLPNSVLARGVLFSLLCLVQGVAQAGSMQSVGAPEKQVPICTGDAVYARPFVSTQPNELAANVVSDDVVFLSPIPTNRNPVAHKKTDQAGDRSKSPREEIKACNGLVEAILHAAFFGCISFLLGFFGLGSWLQALWWELEDRWLNRF